MPSICYVCQKATKNHSPCFKHSSIHKPKAIYIYAEYKDLVIRTIHDYKFLSKRAGAKNIAQLLNDYYIYKPNPPLVTYVPTMSKHIRQRGFDHSKLLAQEFAKLRNWKSYSLLLKTKNTIQVGASRSQRQEQVKGAYTVIYSDIIKGADILLIDDVVTTGSTIEACSALLLDAGATNVEVLAFARTP